MSILVYSPVVTSWTSSVSVIVLNTFLIIVCKIPKYLRSWPHPLTAGPVTPLFPDLIWPEIINQRQSSGPHASKLKHFAPSQHLEQSRVITVQGNQQYRESVREIYISAATNRGERTRARRKLQIGSLSSQERGTLRWQRTMETACQDSISNLCITFPLFPPVLFLPVVSVFWLKCLCKSVTSWVISGNEIIFQPFLRFTQISLVVGLFGYCWPRQPNGHL